MIQRHRGPTVSIWTAKKIQALRHAYQETQAEFAKRFRITPESVRIWEQGRGNPGGPATVVLDQLAAAIGFDPNGPAKNGTSRKRLPV